MFGDKNTKHLSKDFTSLKYLTGCVEEKVRVLVNINARIAELTERQKFRPDLLENLATNKLQ